MKVSRMHHTLICAHAALLDSPRVVRWGRAGRAAEPVGLWQSVGRKRRCRAWPWWAVALVVLLAPWLRLEPAAAQAPLVELPPGFSDLAITEVYGSQSQRPFPPMILDASSVGGVGQERGLPGVAPDPGFPIWPFIYVYYTHSRGTGHRDIPPANCNHRVSRFTLREEATLDPASDEKRYLFVTIGDSGLWIRAQDLTNLSGKILRVDRDGTAT